MLFLDSAGQHDSAYWVGNSVVQGVTTNVTLVRKAGRASMPDVLNEILEQQPAELHAQVLSEDTATAFEEAKTLAGMDSRIRVKIPIVTADGAYRIELVRACLDEGISVNVTASTTLAQAYAALAQRPDYVSLLWCRTRDAGEDPATAAEALARRRDRLASQTRILVGSIREPEHVTEALDSAADIVTVPPAVLSEWLGPGTSLEMARQFRDDAVGLTL